MPSFACKVTHQCVAMWGLDVSVLVHQATFVICGFPAPQMHDIVVKSTKCLLMHNLGPPGNWTLLCFYRVPYYNTETHLTNKANKMLPAMRRCSHSIRPHLCPTRPIQTSPDLGGWCWSERVCTAQAAYIYAKDRLSEHSTRLYSLSKTLCHWGQAEWSVCYEGGWFWQCHPAYPHILQEVYAVWTIHTGWWSHLSIQWTNPLLQCD